MFIPLLNIKLSLPPLQPNFVPRTNLIERLAQNLHQNGKFTRKFTYISAPEGNGKTTLTAQWFLSSEVPVSWLRPAESDFAPKDFLNKIIASLMQIREKISAKLVISPETVKTHIHKLGMQNRTETATRVKELGRF